MKTFSNLWQYLAKFFLEWEVFQIKVAEKSCSSWDKLTSKNLVEPEAANDNMIHARIMLYK
jgi:hypothetical protein